MKYGIFTSVAHKYAQEENITYEEALNRIRALGINALEADSIEFLYTSPDKYKETLDKLSMRIYAVHHTCRLASNNDYFYEDAKITCLKAAENAAVAGAEYLMIVPSTSDDIPALDDRERAKARIIEGLCELAPQIKAYGVTPCIENYSNIYFPYTLPAELLYMVNSIPGLSLVYDIGNFRCVGYDCTDGYSDLRPHVKYYHIKDWSITEENGFCCQNGTHMRGALLGRGCVPVSELLYRLNTDGFSGYIIFEQEASVSPISECLIPISRYIK